MSMTQEGCCAIETNKARLKPWKEEMLRFRESCGRNIKLTMDINNAFKQQKVNGNPYQTEILVQEDDKEMVEEDTDVHIL